MRCSSSHWLRSSSDFEVPPDDTDVGDAESVNVGAAPPEFVTATVADAVFEPPAPVQVSW